jgi:HlyD family secretion protein
MNPISLHALALVAASLLAACGDKAPQALPGYAEAEYVRLAAPISGTLAKLHLKQGETAPAASPAFALEQESERAARQEAGFRVARAQDQLANLRQGKRPDEIAAIQAQRAQAQAALALSSAELARGSKLLAQNFVSPASLDQARANVARDQGRLSELNAELRQGKLGSRAAEISAAEQEVKAAQAQLAQADWKVEQKTQRTPVAGDVVEVLYREGEWVPAGAAVLSLLPPANIKARFFLPQTRLGALAVGQDVSLQCDGCGAPIPAKVSFIARDAEYTAPLIYSKENRAALVFMVEARPAPQDARRLHPGQPLEVRLAVPATGQKP